MDNRRKEIMLGQSVNLANAACLQSKAYAEASSIEDKKVIMHKAIDFYHNIIKEANEKHLPEEKQDQYNPKSNNSYGKTFTPSRNPKVASEKQINWIKKIIANNQTIPLEAVEQMQQKIDSNSLNNNDVNEFVGQFK